MDLENIKPKIIIFWSLIIIVVIILIIGIYTSTETVPAGHVKVGALFGDVDEKPLEEGFHFVNPFKSFVAYDCRQQTFKFDKIGIPSRDQLISTADVSLQWRINRQLAPHILKETGDAKQVFTVHVEPKARSIMRELGKSVEKAENFFLKEEQARLQSQLESALKEYCAPHGITVDVVLLRNLRPPGFVSKAIESKKVREQEAEKQKAELERFKVEQEQKVATAQAEKNAADIEAEKLKVLADARAYEIKVINDAVAQNPAYVQLESIKAMISISENPANQVYFINSESNQPLPLMNIGTLKK